MLNISVEEIVHHLNEHLQKAYESSPKLEQYENPRIVQQDDILLVGVYGSHIYGLATEQSDLDIFIIASEGLDGELAKLRELIPNKQDYSYQVTELQINGKQVDFSIYSEKLFRELLMRFILDSFEFYSILMMRREWMVHVNEEFAQQIKEYVENNVVNSAERALNLRKAISRESDHSFVKGKNKIVKEFKVYKGIKAMFHSLRTVVFGIQIAKHNQVIDFSKANEYWKEFELFYREKIESQLNVEPIDYEKIWLTLPICLMVLCLCFIGNTSARSIAIKNRAGGDLTLVIDFGKGKDSSSSSSEKKKQELPAVDETTKKVIDKVQDVISSSEEKQIAESLLTFANEIRQMEKLIPGSNSEQKLVKQELLAIINEFTKESEKPSAFILKSSLEMVADAKKKKTEQQQAEPGSVSSGAQSLFIQAGISVLNDAMNFVDGIGTYSTKMSSVGNWISGKLATKLDSWGLKSVAQFAKNTGKSIDGLAKKVAPYEQKLAKAIAPVVKSKTFQSIKRVVNVVGGAISIKNGLKHLGMLPKQLPKAFNKLKSTLTKAAAPIKTKAASLIKKVTKSGAAVKKANSAKKAAKAAKDAKKATKAAKKAAKTAKQPGKLAKAFGKAKAVKDVKDGFGDMKSGLFGEGKPKKSQTNNKKQTANNRRTTNNQTNNRRTANNQTANRRTANNQRGNTRNSSTRTNSSRRSTSSSRSSPTRNSTNNRGRQTTSRTSSTSRRTSSPSGRQSSSRSSSSSRGSSGGSRSSGGSKGGRR
ncbi:hypothetical protein NAEGRDRAFT_59759 [Naegleria gruberi]|uniref:Polymerase nucleotidyl transferase domain-containing protein n=1 Tax=Naegleria gruberi TaxID=5762 RepID=D2W0G7_NAEGR|nr:uncharacterized protein NAEGRDRAFT_59759 [Naegleria gruberi]EFC37426.1 hypothetical protein NAEGRDRAFT_59759 [Naegleria gruberi]|eukprot:XP_002670170.1 hypothetical protein NAEGRDRAFT_59759 [Naegleria gruberi strain NEG-M]